MSRLGSGRRGCLLRWRIRFGCGLWSCWWRRSGRWGRLLRRWELGSRGPLSTWRSWADGGFGVGGEPDGDSDEPASPLLAPVSGPCVERRAGGRCGEAASGVGGARGCFGAADFSGADLGAGGAYRPDDQCVRPGCGVYRGRGGRGFDGVSGVVSGFDSLGDPVPGGAVGFGAGYRAGRRSGGGSRGCGVCRARGEK